MKRTAATSTLWQQLEAAETLPALAELAHLSGLLDQELARFHALWPRFPLELRRQLIITLMEITETDFEMDFSAIFCLALQDSDALVRATAIEGLLEQEDPRLISKFITLLLHDPSEVVRIGAAAALGNFVLLGELRKIRPEPFAKIRAALLAIYTAETESLELRRHALEALAYTSLDEVPALIEAAYGQPAEPLRVSAVCAMGRSADRRWAAIVQQELLNIQPDMRLAATRACGELALRDAVPLLAELTEDVNADIRTVALWSLGQTGGDLARRTLQRYTRAADTAVQAIAVAALDELDFFHGDLDSFFGPPEEFESTSDVSWDEDDDADEVDADDEALWY